MFGINELKESILVSEDTVECPVKGCKIAVERQRHRFSRNDKYKCPVHKIYISPSTFEYSREDDNLLWKDGEDSVLLKNIKKVKRESRMARDNSEDALTWNIFRFLERNNLIEKFLASITESEFKSSEVIYWSYSQAEHSSWSHLNEARIEFGEEIKRGSEPDIIINTQNAVFFIEAKLKAGNKAVPSDKNTSKKYETGGDNWFSQVFRSNYKTIAVIKRKYELLRFWLLGSWIAKHQDLDFYLINLVLSEREADIEAIFKRCIKENQRRKFLRVTWESIYQYILNRSLLRDKEIIIRFFMNKTIGYDRNGVLQKAFSIL